MEENHGDREQRGVKNWLRVLRLSIRGVIRKKRVGASVARGGAEPLASVPLEALAGAAVIDGVGLGAAGSMKELDFRRAIRIPAKHLTAIPRRQQELCDKKQDGHGLVQDRHTRLRQG